jgi:SAM-dependent methyltransferase
MNANDDSTASDGDAPPGSGAARSPLGALTHAIDNVLALLAEAQAEADKAGPGAAPRLLAAYRDRFHAAMSAFIDALADALDRAPATLAAASPDNPIAPLIAKARDLPLFRRAQDTLANTDDARELQRVLLNGRGAGFDFPSLLLEDYFRETVFVRTFRSRVTLFGEMLRDEVLARLSGGRKEVRLLNLRCGGLLELGPLLAHPICAAGAAITFVDESTSALRLARQNVERKLALPPRFVRADPLTLSDSLNRPHQPFDLVVTFSQFDVLPLPAALTFARGAYLMLAPGGALAASGYSPDVPRGERALALGLLGARVNCWAEADWSKLLGQAAFDRESARFQRRPPAALAILAQRA